MFIKPYTFFLEKRDNVSCASAHLTRIIENKKKVKKIIII